MFWLRDWERYLISLALHEIGKSNDDLMCNEFNVKFWNYSLYPKLRVQFDIHVYNMSEVKEEKYFTLIMS